MGPECLAQTEGRLHGDSRRGQTCFSSPIPPPPSRGPLGQGGGFMDSALLAGSCSVCPPSQGSYLAVKHKKGAQGWSQGCASGGTANQQARLAQSGGSLAHGGTPTLVLPEQPSAT